MTLTPCNRATATQRLTKRWREQCELFPLMRDSIPLEIYIRANVAHVMKNNLLQTYDKTK